MSDTGQARVLQERKEFMRAYVIALVGGPKTLGAGVETNADTMARVARGAWDAIEEEAVKP